MINRDLSGTELRLHGHLHSASSIDSVSKELETAFDPSQYSSSGFPTVQTNTELERICIITQLSSQLVGDNTELEHAVSGEANHDKSMIFLGLRQTCRCNIAIAD